MTKKQFRMQISSFPIIMMDENLDKDSFSPIVIFRGFNHPDQIVTLLPSIV